jgi:hypothetical protein
VAHRFVAVVIETGGAQWASGAAQIVLAAVGILDLVEDTILDENHREYLGSQVLERTQEGQNVGHRAGSNSRMEAAERILQVAGGEAARTGALDHAEGRGEDLAATRSAQVIFSQYGY